MERNGEDNIADMQKVRYLPLTPDTPRAPYSVVGGGFVIPQTPPNKWTPSKRGRGRPKLNATGTPTRIGASSPADTLTPSSAGSDADLNEGVRKKRKYTRRDKDDSVKVITDIVELTEHIADLLDADTNATDPAFDFADMNFQDLEDSLWCPHEVKHGQSSTDQDEEDITNFNNMIKELIIESDRKRRSVTLDESSSTSATKTTRSTSRPNLLNCRRKALRAGQATNADSPDNVNSQSPRKDRSITWNYRIGGKCTNKWQLFEKHKLEHNVAKQLRENRLTDRLIKVLSSTPQRKLRSRKSSATKSANGDKKTTKDSANQTAKTAECSQSDDLVGNKTKCVGGYCPDIEPTLVTWPRLYARPALYIYQGSEFTDTTPAYHSGMRSNQANAARPLW